MLPHQLLQVMLDLAQLADVLLREVLLREVLLIFGDLVMVMMMMIVIFADVLQDQIIQTGPETTSTSCVNISNGCLRV